MSGIVRADAHRLPLRPGSVDLIVTSGHRRDCRRTITPVGRPRLDPVVNWWSKVDRRGTDECWPWLAATDADGYGRFAVGLGGKNQRHVRAHRYGYELLVGSLDDGLVVCHRCDNPPCCNPEHLFAGTPQANNDDKVAKGRHARVWGTPLTRSRQTHCKHGHPFDEANTYIDPRGNRVCRTCQREASRRAQSRR